MRIPSQRSHRKEPENIKEKRKIKSHRDTWITMRSGIVRLKKNTQLCKGGLTPENDV